MIRIYLTVFSLASLLSTAVAWTYYSYFKSDFAALLVFFGQDGWCEPGSQGIGVHCFGDYASIHFSSLFQVPQGPEVVYPIITRLIRLPFFLIESISNYQVGLVMYLVAILLAVSYPIWHSYFRERNKISITLWITITFLNLGTISSLDRGNVIAFSVPFLYLFFIRFYDRQDKSASLYLTIATIVKPQLALFALLFLWRTEIKTMVIFSLRTVSVVTLPYLIYGTQSFTVLKGWIIETLRWSKSLPSAANFPTNYSFNRVGDVFGVDYPMFSFFLGTILLAGLALPFVVQKRKILAEDLVNFGLVVLCMNSIVYVYYSVLVIPMWVVLLTRPCNDFKRDSGFSIKRKLLPAVLALASAPLAWPSRWRIGDSISSDGAYNVVPLVVTTSIVFYILLVITASLSNMNKSRHYNLETL